MQAESGAPSAANAQAWRRWEDDSVQEPVQPLSREQVAQMGLDRPAVSVWRVLLWQALSGLVLAGLIGGVSGRWAWAVSALYGAASVVLPALVFARGLTGRLSSTSEATSMVIPIRNRERASGRSQSETSKVQFRTPP